MSNALQKIIIFGAGSDGWAMFHRLRSKYQIEYIVDSSCNVRFNELVNGFAVYHPDKLKTKEADVKIVISSTSKAWSMTNQLEQMGFEYERDFLLPYDVYTSNIIYCNRLYGLRKHAKQIVKKTLRGKTLVLIHGNCQTDVYKQNISLNKEFSDQYILLATASVVGGGNDIQDVNFLVETGIIDLCGLFITQSITVSNRFSERVSTQYMIERLPKNCRIVKIPTFYFAGYRPQVYNDSLERHPYTLGMGDRNIDNYLMEGLSDEAIFEKIENENFYTEKIIEDADNELHSFFQREKDVGIDVVVDDFIFNHYRNEVLFYEKNHISESLSQELLNKLFEFIGISSSVKLINSTNHVTRFGIYPSVIKQFGLPFEYNAVSYFFGESIPLSDRMNFRDISQMYIDIMRGVMLHNVCW